MNEKKNSGEVIVTAVAGAWNRIRWALILLLVGAFVLAWLSR